MIGILEFRHPVVQGEQTFYPLQAFTWSTSAIAFGYSFRKVNPNATYCIRQYSNDMASFQDVGFVNDYINIQMVLDFANGTKTYFEMYNQEDDTLKLVMYDTTLKPSITNDAGELYYYNGRVTGYYEGLQGLKTLTAGGGAQRNFFFVGVGEYEGIVLGGPDTFAGHFAVGSGASSQNSGAIRYYKNGGNEILPNAKADLYAELNNRPFQLTIRDSGGTYHTRFTGGSTPSLPYIQEVLSINRDVMSESQIRAIEEDQVTFYDTLNIPPPPAPTDEFISVWDTTKTGTPSNTINFASTLQPGSLVNFTIDWGDGTSNDVISSSDPNLTHVYATPGLKTITVTGVEFTWRLNNGDNQKLIRINKCGFVKFNPTSGIHFYNNVNLEYIHDDINFGAVTNLNQSFYNCGKLLNFPFFDTSKVTNWTQTFYLNRATSMPLYDTSAATTFSQTWRNNLVKIMDPFPVVDLSGMTTTNGAYLMLMNSAVGTQIWTDILIKAANEATLSGLNVHGGSSKYFASAQASRDYLVNTLGWVITDGGLQA